MNVDINWNDISSHGAAIVAELKVENQGSWEYLGDLVLTYIRMRDLNQYVMVPKIMFLK